MSLFRGSLQRSFSHPVPGFHFCAVGDQHCGHWFIASSGRHVQRRAHAAIFNVYIGTCRKK
jgi:hypothetical protein